jgi:peptide-methionine (S)-S-oxide reductase
MGFPSNDVEITTLGGGCFWCLEAVFDEVIGVLDVVSGYSGGSLPNPDYRSVCTGKTGHAEVVQIKFNPKIISYKEILEIFFSIHDPTTLNRQGADVGTQYRSVIFFHNDGQKITAQQVIDEISERKIWNGQIVTELVPYDAFYPAETYHQEYFKKNPYQGYCQIVVAPKVAKFRQKFSKKLKT